MSKKQIALIRQEKRQAKELRQALAQYAQDNISDARDTCDNLALEVAQEFINLLSLNDNDLLALNERVSKALLKDVKSMSVNEELLYCLDHFNFHI